MLIAHGQGGGELRSRCWQVLGQLTAAVGLPGLTRRRGQRVRGGRKQKTPFPPALGMLSLRPRSCGVSASQRGNPGVPSPSDRSTFLSEETTLALETPILPSQRTPRPSARARGRGLLPTCLWKAGKRGICRGAWVTAWHWAERGSAWKCVKLLPVSWLSLSRVKMKSAECAGKKK